MLEIGEGEVDPDAALDDKDQDHRAHDRAEGDEQDREHKADRKQADEQRVAGVGIAEVARAGDVADDQHLAPRIVRRGDGAQLLDKGAALLALDGQVDGQQHAVIVLAPQLVKRKSKRFAQIAQPLGLRVVERDHAVVDHIKKKAEEIHQRHAVIVAAAEQDLVFLVPHAVGLEEQIRLLLRQIQQLGKHAGGIGIGQHMSLVDLNVGKARGAFHLRHRPDLFQDLLFRRKVLVRDKQHNARRAGEGAFDLAHGRAGFGVDKLRHRVVGKGVVHVARAIERRGHQQQKDPHEAAARAHQEASPGSDVRDQAAVRRAADGFREQQDQPRHQQKHRQQAADDALGQHHAEVVAEPEFHQHQRDKARDRRET